MASYITLRTIAAAAAGKWLYYLTVEVEPLNYATNWAHSFDVRNATTWDCHDE